MSSVVIVGAQWGDEGKGKIVDLYTESAELVVRYAGGPNAGHTLVVGDDKIVVRLLPSGILREGTQSVLGQGMVVDPSVLIGEIDELKRRGHTAVEQRLVLSDRAHLILPYHVLIDTLRETTAPEGRALGTTKKGIGPAYEDKARRNGVRAGDLRDLPRLEERITAALEAWAPTITALGGALPDVKALMADLAVAAARLVPILGDASSIVDQAIRGKKRVMLEGAQGTPARHRSRNLSVRDVELGDRGRRGDRDRHRPEPHRHRDRHHEVVHDARRVRTVPDRAQRR